MSTTITGTCGEHYVAAYLAGHGLIVALPRAGMPGTDLFVADPAGGKPIRVQVKTATKAFGTDKDGEFYSWDTSENVIEYHDESLWYAYASLDDWPKGPGIPKVFFIPSAVVVSRMKEDRGKRKRTVYWIFTKDSGEYEGTNGLARMREIMKLKAP
jgi:hypothetical protein